MESRWRLFFVLLLPLTKCEVTIVKTIGRGPDVTEICVNTTQSPIILILCKIRTERSGEECYLFYEPSKDFVQQNYSRFSLKMENQTVSLHLINLTAVDSGNYSCECSHTAGTEILHLQITVEDLEDKGGSILIQIPIPGMIGVTVFIITAVIILCICRRKHHSVCSVSAKLGSSACENPGTLDEDDPGDSYTALQQPDSDLYQSVSNSANHREDRWFGKPENTQQRDRCRRQTL
ncbi:hypothetical protein PBY51_016888 [Eleginops maclovinus]|uniref:Immunoglobulin subtype domain-containing protein n=1 Tax=Eleginops maclovinus TaxID=56733 RepID=A0AAN7W993_ELEMC|nr:hypothetical protein PBY51_016888 [Eleginops maclovinus]